MSDFLSDPLTFGQPLFREFVERFNREEFFESHEALEELWHQHGGEEAVFYQGLIQLAVALEHLTRRNLNGARRLFARAKQKLETFGSSYHGVPLEALLRETETCIAEGRVDGPFPRIPLPD